MNFKQFHDDPKKSKGDLDDSLLIEPPTLLSGAGAPSASDVKMPAATKLTAADLLRKR